MALVFDVNNLKDINDTYGHEYGDIALVNAAKIIRNVYDKANTYRIGGDEIVVILEGDALLDLDKKNERLQKLRDRLFDELEKIPHSAINGDRKVRLSNNFNMCFEGIEGESLLLLLSV